MADSAIVTVWDALEEVIRQAPNPPMDGQGHSILSTPRVYRGETPPAPAPTPALGYVILEIAVPTPAGFYNGQEGEEGIYRMHGWANSPTNALRLGKWLKQLLHHRLLYLEGHQMMMSEVVSLNGPLNDPDRKAWQTEVTYQVRSLETAT